MWKSTHVLQPAKKLNNSAVSKPRAEGERRKILDLFFDAKNIQNPSERSERRKIIIKKIWRAQHAGKKFKHAPFKSSINTKRARIFQNLNFHAELSSRVTSDAQRKTRTSISCGVRSYLPTVRTYTRYRPQCSEASAVVSRVLSHIGFSSFTVRYRRIGIRIISITAYRTGTR